MQNLTRKDNTPLAVIIIIVTVMLLTLGDAAIKGFSAELRLWQIFILRSLIVLPILALILKVFFRNLSFMPAAIGWVALRSLMLTIMWIAYYAALPHLDLSIAAAAYYTLPIFITLFSALFTGESVSRSGWFAVILGFIGVIIILRPSSGDFNLIALLPLLSAILYALAMILTRTKCREEHPLVLATSLNICYIFVGVAATLFLMTNRDVAPTGFLSPDWNALITSSYFALGLMTFAVLVGSIGTAVAYQIGSSSVIATFDFSYVGFATIWGVIFFGERPDIWTLTGISIIVLAGVLALKK